MTDEKPTPERMAELLEQHMQDRIGGVDCVCESEAEAMALRDAMMTRGWAVELGKGLFFKDDGSNEMSLMHIVTVERKRGGDA